MRHLAGFLIRGANCNNGLKVGAAFNVNNAFSNSNWNIGPSHAYRIMEQKSNASVHPTPLAS